jgi:hypothetical protein
MAASNLLFAIALLSVGWGIVSAMNIVAFLSARGVKINWLLMKLMIIKYVSQYEEITKKETGKSGGWFYSFAISMNLALFAGVIGIILRML